MNLKASSVLILGCAFIVVSGLKLPLEMAKVLKANGKFHLNLVGKCPNDHELFRDFFARQVDLDQMKEDKTLLTDQDFVIVCDVVVDAILLTSLTRARRQSTLILVQDQSSFQALVAALTETPINLSFYVFDGEKWSFILRIKDQSQVVVNDLSFIRGTSIIDDLSPDLQGLKVRAIAADWAPYVVYENCDVTGWKCDQKGYLASSVEYLGAELNFTVEYTRQADQNWGVNPVSGPYSLEGEWDGAMGRVVTGEYPISTANWYVTDQRVRILDFAITNENREALVYTPQSLRIDFGLFVRPFSPTSWLGTLIVLVIIAIVGISPYFLVPSYERTVGFMVATTCGWYFFVLINAYYGGALTMFFVRENKMIFDDIVSVMRAYPDWKLMMRKDNDALYTALVEKGHPDYSKYWQRVQANPDEFVADSVAEGLEQIATDRVVFHALAGDIRGFFQENPFHVQSVEMVKAKNVFFNGLILTKNSPLSPSFRYHINKLKEIGILDALLVQWLGKEVVSKTEVNKLVLGSGQMVLGFWLMMGAFICSTVVFLMEKSYKKMKDNHRVLLPPSTSYN